MKHGWGHKLELSLLDFSHLTEELLGREVMIPSKRTVENEEVLNSSNISDYMILLTELTERNSSLRQKWGEGAPERFSDSEAELYAALQRLPEISTEVECVERLDAMVIGQLANHPNDEIAALVFDFIEETLQVDGAEGVQVLRKFAEEMNLGGFKELDEWRQVKHASILALMHELGVDLTCWLREIITLMGEDLGVRYQLAELLSTILLDNASYLKIFIESNGIEAVTLAIRSYIDSDPRTEEEREFLANLFDILCMLDENGKRRFVDYVDVLGRCLKCGKLVRVHGMRLLSFLIDLEDIRRSVGEGLLGVLFSIFMGSDTLKLQKLYGTSTYYDLRKDQEYILNVLGELSHEFSLRERLAKKWGEDGKRERLEKLKNAHTQDEVTMQCINETLQTFFQDE